MPEGPEVKIMSEYVNEVLEDHTITSLYCISEPYLKKYGLLVERIQSFLPFDFSPSFCIGKATFIVLDDLHVLSYHLGMTGYWSTKRSKHAHLRIITQAGLNFYFHDTRRFGNIKLLERSQLSNHYFLQADFLNSETSVEVYSNYLFHNLKSDLEVCKVLLNQRYFPGVGNYLKSEILYVSRIHPHQKWSDLNYDQMLFLCKNTKSMLYKSYVGGGAQLRDFKNPKNAPDLKLLIYGREFTDDNELVLSELTRDNRRTFWSASLQPLRLATD